MCGIAFTWNFPLPPEKVLPLQRHRGPDAEGVWEKDGIQLFHNRLSIQDLQAGQQPMHYGPFHIVFNGEIFNHLALRKQFGLHGKSHSDTETLLLLFEQMGMDMLPHLDGMFVFTLYDERDRTLYLARDREGMKPLYVWQQGESLAAASELNALYRMVHPAIDSDSLNTYLHWGYLPGTETPYRQVQEFLAGHYAVVKDGVVQYHRWWDIRDRYLAKQNISAGDAVQQLDKLLRNAVERRIDTSDLEVGLFLSGGIDSALVAHYAAIQQPGMQAFTVRMPGYFDETEAAAFVAKQMGLRHTILEADFERIEDNVLSILGQYGEPFADDSAIPSYLVAKAAKEHVTVVLNGDGADELFGGYRRYVAAKHLSIFKAQSLKGRMLKMAAPLLGGKGKETLGQRLWRLGEVAGLHGLPAYLAASTDWGLPDKAFAQPWQPDEALTSRIAQAKALHDEVEGMMWLDYQWLLGGVLLPKMDIATMAVALEGRSPFLDKDLQEWVPTLPAPMKVKGRTSKWLLRQLAARHLGQDYSRLPKKGFEIPLMDWMDTRFNHITKDLVLSSGSMSRQLLHGDWLIRLLDNRQHGLTGYQRAKVLFGLLALESWHQTILS